MSNTDSKCNAQSELLPKIQAAVTAVNEAEGTVIQAQGELVAKSKALGRCCSKPRGCIPRSRILRRT